MRHSRLWQKLKEKIMITTLQIKEHRRRAAAESDRSRQAALIALAEIDTITILTEA
jgi:hypothetical protein